MSVADRDYFKQRAEEERARADAATSPEASQIHVALAAEYDALVKRFDERSTLHIAWDDGLRQQA